MTDYPALFKSCWDQEVEARKERSPSFAVEDYVPTGRAAAKYGGKRNIDWWLDNGPLMVEAWDNWRDQHGWTLWEPEPGVPGVELELLFWLSGLDLPIKAFIDRAFVTPTGELVVVDIKTGRTPETSEQLGLYATGIEKTWGIRPKWGYWWSPEKGHVGPYDLDIWTDELLATFYNQTIEGINAGYFVPNPANNCKNWCGVARFCHVVGGEHAVGNDPLAPIPS